MAHTLTAVPNLVRTVRLDDAQLESLLDRLDAARQPGGDNRRRSVRYAYRLRGCIVTLQRPDGASRVAYQVPTRNLSAGGMSFLHGNFLYPATPCTVQLLTSLGAWKHIHGTVVRCTYVEQGIHEVAVRFDGALEPALFSREAVLVRVLTIENDPAMIRLLQTLLGQFNTTVDTAQDGAEALQWTSARLYDLILIDLESQAEDALETVKRLRSAGYPGIIAAAMKLGEGDDPDRCLAAGCDTYIGKPFTKSEVGKLLALSHGEPLISHFAADDRMAETIALFVSELPGKLRVLTEALSRQDLAALALALRGLKAAGSSHGFEPISESAAHVEKALLARSQWDEIEKRCRDLMRLCRSARGPSLPQTPTVQSPA